MKKLVSTVFATALLIQVAVGPVSAVDDEEGPIITALEVSPSSVLNIGDEFSVTLTAYDPGGAGIRNFQFVMKDKFDRQHTPDDPLYNCQGSSPCSIQFTFRIDQTWANNGFATLSSLRAFDNFQNGTYYYRDGRVENLQSKVFYPGLSPFSGFTIAIGTVSTPTPTPPATPTPTPPATPVSVKYKNCAALNKVYPGGVAKAITSRNKGGKIRRQQVVNVEVYRMNKSLDRDKDGLVCER